MKFFTIARLLVLLLAATISSAAEKSSHPRLYFNANELDQLRHAHSDPIRKRILKNLVESADWCLTKTPRTNWIAPVSPDPIYENLYDRFYGIMGDLAITEHLSFAYALSGKKKYGEAARQWVLASCRVWQREADGAPDGGKAYAVSRLLKGIAVGYDAAHDRFTEAERKEIRDTLTRIGRLYYEKYFQTPTISGPGFHTHHAVVEWSSFGVLALTLLGEEPQAQTWLDATVKKFEEHLLPTGLAPDGAQVEGGSFWASTMQYRLFFMDPLRRVTGRDLFKNFAPQMNADLALAEMAAEKFPGYEQSYANVVLQPYYAQADYYAPILLFLAREYRRPIYQHFALWDHSLGHIQKTRAITPHGEQLIFELGGYSYLWFDPGLKPKADEKKLSFKFPSVEEAYLRASWEPGDLLVGVSKGQLIIHAGGQPVLIEPGLNDSSTNLTMETFEDTSTLAKIRYGNSPTNFWEIKLNREKHELKMTRHSSVPWQFWAQGKPNRTRNELRWKNQVSLQVASGEILEFNPQGHETPMRTGFNKLALLDPAPMKFPLIKVAPASNDEILIQVRFLKPPKRNQDAP